MAKHIRRALYCLLLLPHIALAYTSPAECYGPINVSTFASQLAFWCNSSMECACFAGPGTTGTCYRCASPTPYMDGTATDPTICGFPSGVNCSSEPWPEEPPPEPCVSPATGDPGACVCPFPYIEDESGACVSDTCTHEMPYLEAEPGVPTGTVGCFAGCAYTAVTTVDVADPATSYTQMKPNGTDCPSVVPEPPPIVGTPDPTQCVTDALGNSVCIDGNAPTNCGTVNGEYVCIPSMEDNSCVSTPGGSIVCIGSGAPDTGADGTPENPTPVPAPAFQLTGLPEPASGTTGTDGSDQAPVQIWPVGEGTGAALFALPGTDTDGDGLDDGGTVATADPDFSPADAEELLAEVDEPNGGPFGAMSWYVPETGQCPAPTAMEVFGTTSYVEWDVACDLMEMIRPFVIALGAMNALMMLMHFGR